MTGQMTKNLDGYRKASKPCIFMDKQALMIVRQESLERRRNTILLITYKKDTDCKRIGKVIFYIQKILNSKALMSLTYIKPLSGFLTLFPSCN